MRYFEWLFPIQKYIRLRKEVSGLRAALTWLVVWLAVTCVPLGLTFWQYVQAYKAGSAWASLFSPAAPPLTTWQLLEQYVKLQYADIASIVGIVLLVLLLILLLEFLAALVFVRKRPGRRRPLCTKQTLKNVVLGSQTWLLLGIAFALGVYLLSRWIDSIPSPSRLDWQFACVLIAGVVGLGGPLVLMGSTAVQAANAVIVLQDDRMCGECGYFLIHLTQPRCPECGTPFDPAKLGSAGLTAVSPSECGGDDAVS